MRNPYKPIPSMDDRAMTREEIEKLVAEMMRTDEKGYPTDGTEQVKTA